MLAFKYLLGVFLFIGVFQLGRLMTKQGYKWSVAPGRVAAYVPGVQKIFLYGGRIFQVVAVIFGFLDAVSVIVLVL